MYSHSSFWSDDLKLAVLRFWWKKEHGEQCLNEYFSSLTDLLTFESLLDHSIGAQILPNLCMRSVWEIILEDPFLKSQFNPNDREMVKNDMVYRFVGGKIKSTQWWATNKKDLKKLSMKVKKVRKVMKS
jgi:hypothetical protein